MLNTHKLVYILPELAYIAELLPDKKPYTFSIQSFTQVNGELLKNNDSFIAANVAKLMKKLEGGEEYHLILPDFLFANTIVTLKETSEAKITEELEKNQLPSMGISKDTHYVQTFVLNELRGTSRVQIAAIEKELILPIKGAADAADIKLSGISPLSWSIKSVVSLEPSISVVQLGEHLFASEHYIGVDQSTVADISEVDTTVETIKTLKGAEPSIQTVYLLANASIEKELKEALSDTVPLQQMADDDSSDDRMPSYVRTAIEASMRTLSIPDYPVPIFELGKLSAEEKKQFEALAGAPVPEVPTAENAPEVEELPKPDAPKLSDAAKAQEEEEPQKPTEETEKTAAAEETSKEAVEDSTTQQTEATETAETADEEATEQDSEPEQKTQSAAQVLETASTAVAATATVTTAAAAAESAPAAPSTGEAETETLPDTPVAAAPMSAAATVPKAAATPTAPVAQPPKDEPTPATNTDEQSDDDIDLAQFTQSSDTEARTPSEPTPEKAPVKQTPVIKNKSGVGHMIKMILITIGVLLATVALGVGIALAYIRFASPAEENTPAVEVSATPTPTPEAVETPEVASESATLPDDLQILVVNATTKAGYAGTIKGKIDAEDLGTVTAGNAKGSYSDEGTFIYQKENNTAVVSALEEATDLTLTENADAADEDAAGKYDVIIVLAE